MTVNQFPLINLSGTAYERGLQHGEMLADKIKPTVDFYHSIFNLSESQIFRHARHFAERINAFNPSYCKEIEGIGEGADVDRAWIYALNSRTEILSHRDIVASECTSAYFPESSILAQNWDWGKALEPLTVLMNIVQADGHIVSMITEPGIIGKIGMNNAGLGVCLNILSSEKLLDGLPVHIILRAILDCRKIEQVDALLDRHGMGKASNIIVADAGGKGFGIEFYADRQFRLDAVSSALVHTNHYLGKNINSVQDPDFFSSYARYQKAEKILKNNPARDVSSMCDLLSDDSNSDLPIYRDYAPNDTVHELGTVCSVVMNLPEQTMLVRRGKRAEAPFLKYRMQHNGLGLV